MVWLWPTTAWFTMDFFQQFDDSTLDMFFKNLVHLGPHLGSYSYSSTFSGVKYQMSNPLVGFWPNTTWLLKPLILAMKYDILFLGTTNLKFCFWVFLSTYLNPPNFSDMIRLFTRALVLGWPKTAWWPNFIDFPSKRGAILNCLPRFLFCSRPGRRIFGQCSRASFSAVCGPFSPRFRAWGVPCSSASLWTTFLGLCVLFGHEFFGLRRVVCTPRFFGLAATLAFPAAWMLALRPRMGYEVGIMDALTLSLQIQEIKAAHEAGEYHGQEDVKAAIRAVATEEVLADPNLCKFDWLRVCAKLLGRAGSGSGRSAEVLRRELCQDLYGVVPGGPPPLAPPYLPLVAATPLGNGDLSALVRATQPGAAQPVASTGALATGGMAAQTLPASPPATTAAAVTAAGAAPADPSRLMRVLPGGAAPPVVHTSPHTSPGHWAAAPYAASAAATPGVAAPESAATAAAGAAAVNLQLTALGDGDGGRDADLLQFSEAYERRQRLAPPQWSPSAGVPAVAPTAPAAPAFAYGATAPAIAPGAALGAPATAPRAPPEHQHQHQNSMEELFRAQQRQQLQLQRRQDEQLAAVLHQNQLLMQQLSLRPPATQQVHMAGHFAPEPPAPAFPPGVAPQDHAAALLRAQWAGAAPGGAAAAAPPYHGWPAPHPGTAAPTGAVLGNDWGAPVMHPPPAAPYQQLPPVQVRYATAKREAVDIYSHMVARWGSAEQWARKSDLAGTATNRKLNAITMARAVDAAVRNDRVNLRTSECAEMLLRRLCAMSWAHNASSWEKASYLEEQGVGARKSDGLSGLPTSVRAGAARMARQHLTLDGRGLSHVAELVEAQLLQSEKEE